MTPFGKLVTPNITPDKDTGIGNYSAEDFRQAMKTGVAPGGKLLYPAMPYPSYARMSDGDIAALWDYMRSVKPVKNQVDVNQLRFPFNQRFMLRGWNLLFFRPVTYASTAGKSAEWNRGAYLVNGAGHCGACHTPKNAFGADKSTTLTGASSCRAGSHPTLPATALRGWARGALPTLWNISGPAGTPTALPPARWPKRWKIPPRR